VKGGQLRGIAVTGPQRAAALAEVPTVGEARLPELQFVSWNGVHVAAGTPASIVARLNAEFAKALDLPDVRQRMSALGLDPRGGSPEAFGDFARADAAQWAKVVKETGVKTD